MLKNNINNIAFFIFIPPSDNQKAIRKDYLYILIYDRLIQLLLAAG
tara:strand:+ start:400 stop:537 length:138 start_codon:yes stop_codon:yes gene_type:complete